jgi:hypothetical protein
LKPGKYEKHPAFVGVADDGRRICKLYINKSPHSLLSELMLCPNPNPTGILHNSSILKLKIAVKNQNTHHLL